MACCHVYDAGYACGCAEPWREDPQDLFHVGARVRIRESVMTRMELPPEMEFGTVVQVDKERQGCLVRPEATGSALWSDGQAFGWAFHELVAVVRLPAQPDPPTRYERDIEV